MTSGIGDIELPSISAAVLAGRPHPKLYIGAAGFEDRCLAWLESAAAEHLVPEHVITVQYLPRNRKNRVVAFKRRIDMLGVPAAEQTSLTYNRFDPNQFCLDLEHHLGRLSLDDVVVDVSGMSKLLIVVLLKQLADRCKGIEVVCGEARVYYPLERDVDLSVPPRNIGTYLTKDVYTIASTDTLASVAMQGYPNLIVAFATFNFRELEALANELSPQMLIVIEGEPHDPVDGWRLEAVRAINQRTEALAQSPRKVLKTFDYVETMAYLEEVYQTYGGTHKVIIAPTGSKLQTLGVALFKFLRPDVQIVYPVTSDFAKEYTRGCRALWAVRFEDWPGTIDMLTEYRRSDLRSLREAIRSAEARVSGRTESRADAEGSM